MLRRMAELELGPPERHRKGYRHKKTGRPMGAPSGVACSTSDYFLLVNSG